MRLLFIFFLLALREGSIIRGKEKKVMDNLMDFPFRLLESLDARLEGGGVEVVGEDDDEALVISVVDDDNDDADAEDGGDGEDEDEDDAEDDDDGEDGLRCVEKVMMVEETEWEEVMNCEVSHEERCHQSYVTRYTPSQEEKCQDHYRKVCTIDFQTEASEETVEVCGPELLTSCDEEEEEEGEKECRTVYQTECSTSQTAHQVLEDVVDCQTVSQERCQDLTEGTETRRDCQSWPVRKCVVSQRNNTRHSPVTLCNPRPRHLCVSRGCRVKEGPLVCEEHQQTRVRERPVERCELQPEEKCEQVTRLLPALHTTNTCLQVPRELCALARLNPRKIRKPTVKKWCFNQEKLKGLFE